MSAPRQPHLEDRDPQQYVAIPTTVTLQELPEAVERYLPQVFGWLQTHNIEPAGAPFIRYLYVDMERGLEIELAVPVPSGVEGDGQVISSSLPGGRYVTLLHVGHYDGLVSANALLQNWAEDHEIQWQMTGDSRWTARIEQYLTDPAQEPDPSRWETELAYLTAAAS